MANAFTSMDILQKLCKFSVKQCPVAVLYSSGSSCPGSITFKGITSGSAEWLSETDHIEVKVSPKAKYTALAVPALRPKAYVHNFL